MFRMINFFRKMFQAICLSLSVFLPLSTGIAEPLKPTQIALRYNASLAGVYVGSARLQLALTKQAYNFAGSGSLSGILKKLYDFRISVQSYGTLSNRLAIPQYFATKYGTKNSTRSVKIRYDRHRKADVSADPPFFPSRSTIPLKPAHLTNTLDPLSALFMPVRKGQSSVSLGNCRRLMPVFDGRLRYNLKITSAGGENSKPNIRGFKGPSLNCRVKFQPVAGYSKHLVGLKKLERNNEMEIWLTPIGTSGFLIPIKGRMPTPYGIAEFSIRQAFLNGQKVAAL